MYVSNILQKDVKTVGIEDDLNKAAQVMWEEDCGCVPVLDKDQKVVSMLTDRDVCMAAFTQGKALREMSVSSTMSKGLFACSAQDTVAAAEQVMQHNQVRRLPVVDAAGRLMGVVSLQDIAQEAARQRLAATPEVTDEEVGVTLAKIGEPRKERSSQAVHALITVKPAGAVQPPPPVVRIPRAPAAREQTSKAKG